jgi:hypothetical protein
MKKLTLALLTIFILTLTACGSAANGTDPASMLQSGAPAGELPETTQLMLGILKLEDTDQTITAEQASELLPLWQTLQVLSESDTAAQQEIEAVIDQIQETMTAEQMQSITDMNLTREDMLSVMREQGITMGTGPTGAQSNNQNGNSSNNNNRNPGPGAGMAPPDERGFQGGGPGFGGEQGQSLNADQIATAQAARQAGGGNMISAPLLNAVIQYLQEKAAS